jgi:hypothetical protein
MVQITNHIELTESGQKRWRRQRAATLLRWAFVACLVVIVLVFPVQVIVVFFMPVELFKKPRGYSEILFNLTWLLIMLMFLAALFGVMILMSSKKLPVLYLRRFGLIAANRRISQAIERGLGRYYRVVTLDDSSFRPIEVPRWQRIFSRVGISVVSLAFAVVAAALFFMNRLWGPSHTNLRLNMVDAIGAYIATVGFFIGMLGIPLLILFVLFAAMLAWRWHIRRRSRLEVRSRGDIERCLGRVRRLAGWLGRPSIMAPQAVVVNVVDELWQETVSELAIHVGLVIVDVSEPTANLIWELEQVFTNPQIVCLLVGDGLMVRKWVEEDGDLHLASAHSRMRALLQAWTILVCESQLRSAQRTYARNLRRWLGNIADAVRTS